MHGATVIATIFLGHVLWKKNGKKTKKWLYLGEPFKYSNRLHEYSIHSTILSSYRPTVLFSWGELYAIMVLIDLPW